MLRALTALIILLFVPLLVLPLLIVAIAAGPVVITVLFVTGCGGGTFVLSSALLGIALSLRALVKTLIGSMRRAGSSTPRTNAAG